MPESHSKPDLPQRLADAFSRLIRDVLAPEAMAEVLRRNRNFPTGACATHSFCDAGAQMVRAFRETVGYEPDTEADVDVALWNAAWALAKNADFPRRLELRNDVEGRPVYAFSIRDSCIIDPRQSEDFFHSVDPEAYYGLRPEELSAFDHANSMLRAEAAQASTLADVAASGQDRREVATIAIPSPERPHPHIEVWHTGGGCHALRIECAGGGYILITEHDNAQVPPPTATEVDVGRYAANGDQVESESSVPVNRLQSWIADAMDRACQPQNVRDYFVLRLGADPLDGTLADLPLESACGRDCARAIDSTAELRRHVHAAFGHSFRDPLVELARRVVGVFWRG